MNRNEKTEQNRCTLIHSVVKYIRVPNELFEKNIEYNLMNNSDLRYIYIYMLNIGKCVLSYLNYVFDWFYFYLLPIYHGLDS